jgi:hypothetical protein
MKRIGRSISKVEVLRRLRRLRTEIVAGMENGPLEELPLSQATILTDVCQVLGLNEAETYYVVGEAFRALTDRRDSWPVLQVPVEVLGTERADA